MAIVDGIIKQVKYPPELIPDAWFGNINLNAEAAPAVLDLRQFNPYLVRLTNIQVVPSANVNLRARYDDVSIEQNTLEMLNLPPAVWALPAAPLPGAWDLPAKKQLRYNLFGVAAFGPPPYSTHYGVWVYLPTIADKLEWGIALNQKEQAINQELGISDTVEKGLLPMPISQLIEREYHCLGEETHTRNININLPAVPFTLEVLNTKPNEILVLTRIAAIPGTAAQNVQIIVDRDIDANFATFPTYPLELSLGSEISCFIPALTQIRLTTMATVAPGFHQFRYTFRRVKLTNILRVRFGILTEAEAPADLYKKVMGGIC